MKSCKECALYDNGVCMAWDMPASPDNEPCDKFRLSDKPSEDEVKAYIISWRGGRNTVMTKQRFETECKGIIKTRNKRIYGCAYEMRCGLPILVPIAELMPDWTMRRIRYEQKAE